MTQALEKVKEIYRFNIDTEEVQKQLKQLSKMSFSLDTRRINADAGLAFNEGKETFSLKGVSFPKDGLTDSLNLQWMAGRCVDEKFRSGIVPPSVSGSKLGDLTVSEMWDMREAWYKSLKYPSAESNPSIWGGAYQACADDFLDDEGEDYVCYVPSSPLHYVHLVLSNMEKRSFLPKNTVEDGWVYTECDKAACMKKKHVHAVRSTCLTRITLGDVEHSLAPPLKAVRGRNEPPVTGTKVVVQAVHSFAPKTVKREVAAVYSVVNTPSVSETPSEAGDPPYLGEQDEEKLVFGTARDALVYLKAKGEFEHVRSVMQNAGNLWRAAVNNFAPTETARQKKRRMIKAKYIAQVYSGKPKPLKEIFAAIDKQIGPLSDKDKEAHISYFLTQLTLGGQSRLACVDGDVVPAVLE